MRDILAALMLFLVIPVSVANAEICIASVYTTKDHDQNGTNTASGVPLDDDKPTAAHKTRKLLTSPKITNLKNGVSQHIRLTDRGPYIKGRCIDLSRAAAILLGCDGLCPVKVE